MADKGKPSTWGAGLSESSPAWRSWRNDRPWPLVPADEKELANLQMLTDVAALERILFNLIDNACKYARAAADKRIHIEVAPEGKGPHTGQRPWTGHCLEGYCQAVSTFSQVSA